VFHTIALHSCIDQGECLLGYVTKESKTVLNPPDKGDQNLSRHVIRMVITIAWS
jgi:hypothetical protein